LGSRVAHAFLLLLALAPAGVAARPAALPPRPNVTAVVLKLPSGVPPGEFRPLVVVQAGQPLDPRAVRRSIELLFATGKFSDVVVRSRPDEGGILVEVECTPVAKVHLVVLTGNTVLNRTEVLAAAHLAEKSDYFNEKLAEAKTGILQAYARRGFHHAEVTITTSHSGPEVDITVAILEGPPTRVGEVRFVGTPGLPIPKLREAFGLPVGAILDQTVVEKGTDRLRDLYRQTHHYRARVSSPTIQTEATGAVVNVPVDAGPELTFAISGNRRFPSRQLLAVLDYDSAEVLDRAAEGRLARRLEVFYRYRGFADVQVAPSEEVDPKGGPTAVVFAVDEGPVLRVTSITFDGAVSLSDTRLRRILSEVIEARTPPLPGDARLLEDPVDSTGQSQRTDIGSPPIITPLEVFVEEAYRAGADALQATYRDDGFLTARVELTVLDWDAESHQAQVRFRVQEGVQTRVQSVTFEGLPEGFAAPPPAPLTPGTPLSARASEALRLELLRSLGRASYLFARVDILPEMVDGGRNAKVVVRTQSGPAVRVGQVVVRGLQRTDEKLVRRNLVVRSGQPLDPEEVYASQANLLALGIFRQVSVTLLNPDAEEPVKDVLVEARERALLSGSGGLGYSTVDGPRIVGDLVFPNLFGEAINFTARGKINYVGLSLLPLQDFAPAGELQGLNGIDFNFNGTLSQARVPWLLPQNISARLTVVAERVHQPSYFFSRVAAIGGMVWQLLPWLSFIGQYTVEGILVRQYDTLSTLLATSSVDITRLRFPTGNYILQTLSPGFTLDFRDNPINPHKGLLITTVGELTKDISAESTDAFGNDPVPASIFTWKISGGVTGYIPVNDRVVLALSVRGGRIFNLIDGGEIIAPQRFYLGGVNTLRGFPEDGVIPQDERAGYAAQRANCAALVWPGGCTAAGIVLNEGRQVPSQGGVLFTLIKAELRFPAILGFDFGVFLEAGNLWADASLYRPFVLRPVAGVGLRYGTPIGPLALDLGFNLAPDASINEQIAAIQFSVGLF
jgi:outer membrane protein insertion porin family